MEEAKNQEHSGNNNGEDPQSWTSLLVMAQKRQNLLRQMKQELVLNIIIFLILLVIVLFSVRINTQSCGESLLIWLIVYIVFFLFKVLHSLANLCSVYKNSEKVHTLAAIKFLLINPFQIAWLIYGNVLYFGFNSGLSCPSSQLDDINRLSTFVLITLILGYIQLIYFVLIVAYFIGVLIKRSCLRGSTTRIRQEAAGDNPSNQSNRDRIIQIDDEHISRPLRNIEQYIEKLKKEKFKEKLSCPEDI